MKIIFECNREKEEFFNDECPSIFDLKEHRNCGDGSGARSHCQECWEQSGLEYEIKNEESIKMTDKVPKEFTYTDAVYELIKDECEGMDSIYEDYIVKLVGNCGLAALKRANLIESCGVLNCRKLYVLCKK